MSCLVVVCTELVLVPEPVGSSYGIRPPKIFLSLLSSKDPILRVGHDIVVVIATLAWRSLTSLLIP